jgi:methionyl-tRNA formyltransferase
VAWGAAGIQTVGRGQYRGVWGEKQVCPLAYTYPMAKIVFMGTPALAVPVLDALVTQHEVIAVYTQPDAPAGRGKTVAESPVKQAALAHGIAIFQPETLKPVEEVERLRALAPDLIIVAAFGQILRQNVLDIPAHGCINVHFSLLPRWRGASPVSAAIAAGDAQTGVAIMRMDAGLDTGPVLSMRAIDILPDDTTASLTARLADVGAALLIETLPAWLAGEITPQAQPTEGVTLVSRLKKEQGRIDWTRPATEIERHVRAMQPWPGAFTEWRGKGLKVLAARLDRPGTSHAPGTLFAGDGALYAQCGDGALRLLSVQLEGKRAMQADEFLRGQRL